MNGNNSKPRYYKEELDFRELVMALWKRKKIIISMTLMFALIAGIISIFVLSPKFDSKLNIVISMPETYTTRYGDYKLPITTYDQYINLITSNDVLINTIKDMQYDTNLVTVERLKERIKIEVGSTKANTVQNSYYITVSAENAEESLKLAQSLYNNYIEFMDVMTKDRAISFFINDFNVKIKSYKNQLESTKEILKRNEELLAETPQVINQGKGNIELQTKLSENSDYVIPIDTINPNYIKIENDIVNNKQTINSIESSINMNNKYLEELSIEKNAINKYYETGSAKKLESSVISIVETSIYLPSPPIEPTEKTSPNNLINIIIGAFAGFMLGILTVLIKEYWIIEDKLQ
jgi:capsular polysaccharide biosynthesis protein